MSIVAVIIPCYNEELTIKKVINDFQEVIPEAKIYVFDNNSTDKTAEIAQGENVQVYLSPYQGKGNVIRHAFAIIDADYYIVADGDDQCDTSVIPSAIAKMKAEQLDMLTLVRRAETDSTYRKGHAFGNKVFNKIARFFFAIDCTDILGGYRVFSKPFVKSYPADVSGFDIEVSLSIFALQQKMKVGELPVPYRDRPEGSFSKLNTFRDGFLILRTICSLILTEKPLWFFSIVSATLGSIATIWFLSIYIEFLQISAVPRYPSLILNTLLFVLSALSLSVGIILFYINKGIKEQRRYMYIKFSKDR